MDLYHKVYNGMIENAEKLAKTYSDIVNASFINYQMPTSKGLDDSIKPYSGTHNEMVECMKKLAAVHTSTIDVLKKSLSLA